LFNFLILVFGPFVGNFLWPELRAFFTGRDGVVDWQSLFLFPSGAALAAAILLLLFFHPPKLREIPVVVDDEELSRIPASDGQIATGFPEDKTDIRRSS
jgi:hypothetical protein